MTNLKSTFRVNLFAPGYTATLFIFLLFSKSLLFSFIQVAFPESDSFSYLTCTLQMSDGELPLFFMRPPGYPIFILFVWTLFGINYKAIIIMQLFVSALAWSVAYHGITRHTGHKIWIWIFFASLSLVPLFAVADWFILTESLGLSLLLITLGLSAMYLHHANRRILVLSGFAATLTFLVKLALVPILLIIPVITIFANTGKQRIWSLGQFGIAPLVLLTSLSFYNKYTIGTFSLMPFGQFNRLIGVMHILQTNDSSDPDMQSAIASVSPNIQHIPTTLFTHTLLTENMYQQNAKRIYDIAVGFTGNNHLPPWEIYSKCGPLWWNAVNREPALYGNFLWNNAIFYVTNTRQYIGSVNSKLNQHIQYLNNDPMLVPDELKSSAAIGGLMAPVLQFEAKFPRYIELLFSLLNKLFRHTLYWLLLPITITIVLKGLIPPRMVLFSLLLVGFISLYGLLVIYSSNAALDRYSIYSDISLYLLIPLLIGGFRINPKQL